MSAMLLGDKSTLEPEIKALYQSNGIVHILSISGLHITIIGMSLFRLLRRMGAPVWVAAIAGGMVLFLYGVMTGLSVSACRAIGMYLLRMLSEAVGRTYDMLTALGVTAVVTLWVNPGYLYNAGFYLSYGAVLGIGILYPALLPLRKKETLLKYVGDRRKQIVYRIAKIVREKLTRSMLASLAITLTTLPIQLWFFYEVPVYSLILNLLVIPFMSVVMACGIFAMLIPGLGIIGTVDCLILSGYEILCKSFEQLPFHTWNPGKPEGWQVVIYYTLLLVCCWVSSYGKQMHTSQEAARKLRGEERHKLCVNPWKELHGKSRKELCRKSWKELRGRLRQELCRKLWKELYGRLRKNLCRRLDGRLWKVIPGMLTIAVIVLGVRIPGPTTITFLDVGQGDCICMQTTSGEVYMFDCGSTSRSLVGEYVLKPYLKYEGIRHIDGIFVSHSDSDHYNGVQELLENQNEWGITVDNLVLPGEIVAGDTWECESGSVRFTCLHPSALEAFEDSNAFSQCFYVEMADAMSLLLTGDVEGEGEAQLLQELQKRNITQATVLKVAHHGSRYSTSEAFLEQCKPEVAIISAGRNNSYGHPHEALLERLDVSGALIWSTQEYGAITIEVGEKLKLRSWLSFE